MVTYKIIYSEQKLFEKKKKEGNSHNTMKISNWSRKYIIFDNPDT